MSSRTLLFDHFINPLTELKNIAHTPRSWLLNQFGKSEFSMSTSDRKCQEKYLQFGNLIHVQHIPSVDWTLQKKGKLPDWTGMILPNREWDEGILHNTAYSAEAILAFRAMPYQQIKGSPKEVFLQILQYAHQRAKNIIINPGIVDDLPTVHQDDLRTNAYDHICNLCKKVGMDWDVTGELDNQGNLKLFANLYARKGIDTSFSLNNSNTELQSSKLSEQGTPSNHIFGYSHEQTNQRRLQVESLDQSSIDDYGSLELNQVYVGVHDGTTVQNASDARISQRSRPVIRVTRTALDKRNTFDFISVGNTVTVKDTKVGFNLNGGFGFEKQFRILSVSYNDLSNRTQMNIEVI